MADATIQGPPASGEAKTARPITLEVRVRVQAMAIPEEDGGYSVFIPALPGCVSEGETIEDAQAGIVEAAEGWLASQHDRRKAEALRVAIGP